MKEFTIKMECTKFSAKKLVEVEKNYFLESFIDKESNIGYSVVRTHLNGSHPLMKNIKSNRTYYILEGYGTFFAENKEIVLQKGEMILIPKNTKYKFEGKFDALLIDCPAFAVEDDVIYE